MIRHSWTLWDAIRAGAADALPPSSNMGQIAAEAAQALGVEESARLEFSAMAEKLDPLPGVDPRLIALHALSSLNVAAARKCVSPVAGFAGVYVCDVSPAAIKAGTIGDKDDGFVVCGEPIAEATKARLAIILTSGVFGAAIIPPVGTLAVESLLTGMAPGLRMHFGRAVLQDAKDWVTGRPTVLEVADLLYGSRDATHRAVRFNGGWRKLRDKLAEDLSETVKGFRERLEEERAKLPDDAIKALEFHISSCAKLAESVKAVPLDARDIPAEDVPAEKLGAYMRESAGLTNAEQLADQMSFLEKNPEGDGSDQANKEGGGP